MCQGIRMCQSRLFECISFVGTIIYECIIGFFDCVTQGIGKLCGCLYKRIRDIFLSLFGCFSYYGKTLFGCLSYIIMSISKIVCSICKSVGSGSVSFAKALCTAKGRKKTKKRLISNDLFQTPEPQRASELGCWFSFLVLPMLSALYMLGLSLWFNPIQIESSIIKVDACSQFNFTCKSIWGCEVAAIGVQTSSRFSKGRGIIYLDNGESMREKICSGLTEAFDIAPRAAVTPADLALPGFNPIVII